MNFFDIVKKFNNVKVKGDTATATCPCHDDKKSSLSITNKGDRTLIKCFAGCDTRDILNAVGLEWSDLFLKPKVKAKTWVDDLGADVEAKYNYGDYYKIRYKGKRILYGYVENNRFKRGMPEGVQRTMYNINRVKKAIGEGYTVYICEGEKDVDTLTKMGYAACTMGGAGDWNKKYAEYFKGADVVLLPDNDEAGKKVMETIKKDLKYYAHRVRVVLTSEQEKGDVTDWVNEGHNKEQLKELVNNADSHYAPWCKVNDNDECKGINGDLLSRALSKNMDYVVIKQQGIDVENIYIYKNGIYKKCSKSDFKAEIKKYIGYGFSTDNILNNVYNLTLCTDSQLKLEDMNKGENLINFKNGVLNLDTMKIEGHNPKYLHTRQLKCNFDYNAKVPDLWIDYINHLSDGREDIKNLLQECIGLLISNVKISKLKKCFILYSPLGDTGKSVFLNIIKNLVGADETINIPIQNMDDRFALSDLYGKRLNIVGDQTAIEVENSSTFKQLTGGDSVKIEYKGKQCFDWTFDGGIIIACNKLPYFKDDKGGHIFDRLCIISCKKVVPEDKRDINLTDKLLKNPGGIVKWAIEGLIRLRDNNFKLTYSELTKEVKEEYRKLSDTLYNYVTENYKIVGDQTLRVPKKDFEDDYKKWCSENGYNSVNKQNIKVRAEAMGIGFIKSCGYRYYTGLEPILFKETENNEELPEGF